MRARLQDGIQWTRAKAYYASKSLFSDESRSRLKTWLLSRRKKWAWAYRSVYGRYDARELVAELSKRVPADFKILMVHSAFDRLLPMYRGTPGELVEELLRFCGSERTLVMPAFVLRAQSHERRTESRRFDVRRTPSEMGILTELFRRIPGVRRSLHPTHSVCAYGPLAEQIVGSHHLAATPSGKDTPFEMMAQKGAIIVGLGVEYFRCLTQIHAAEHLLGDEFPVIFQKEQSEVTVIDVAGGHFVYPLTVFRPDRVMNASVVRTLLPAQDLQEWSYHGSPLFMTFADRLTRALIEAARRGITVYS